MTARRQGARERELRAWLKQSMPEAERQQVLGELRRMLAGKARKRRHQRLGLLALLMLATLTGCSNPTGPECRLLRVEQREGYSIEWWDCPRGVEPPCRPGHACPPVIVVPRPGGS